MQKRKALLNFHPKVISPDTIWVIPIFYILVALALGRLLPQVDRVFYSQGSYFSPSTANSLLSAIASGMITFTGFVFSMLIVMVQFGSSAYTPRIARYFIQDPIIAHALGIFIATFLYSLIALSQVDFASSGTVPDFTVATAMVFLLSSVLAFLLLISRTTSLQINNVLYMLGARGEKVIRSLYPSLPDEELATSLSAAQPNGRLEKLADQNTTTPGQHKPNVEDRTIPEHSAILDEIYYEGRPKRLLTFDFRRLVHLAQTYDLVIQILPAVGDMVSNRQKIVSIYGKGPKRPGQAALARIVKSAIHAGPERTIEQDPRFAIRLIVDIAIRALSPAINDPTTAVQALDQLYDLLHQIAIRDLDVGFVYDDRGALRVIYPTPDWDDFITLATDEIRSYGAGSLQVMRRLRALLTDLSQVVPSSRVPAVMHELERVNATIARAFPDPEDQMLAQEPDRQGISIVK